MRECRLDYTDGWHPTVNPSARMAVHHFRLVEVLGRQSGLLNEIPRPRGGSTLRLVRFAAPGQFAIINLPGTLECMPWWLRAADARASKLVEDIYQLALADDRPVSRERAVFARVLEEFRAVCARAGRLTIGEALYEVMQELHAELVPELPKVALVSLTRAPERHVLADALSTVPGGLLPTLARWARLDGQSLWGMLAVGIDRNGQPLRVRFLADSRRLEFEVLHCMDGLSDARRRVTPRPLSENELVDSLRDGRLIPSSRLAALAEVVLHAQGWQVRHFGNTYGRLNAAGRLLDVPDTERIPCCRDDADSWHWADLRKDTQEASQAYPLHLIDSAACGPDGRAAVPLLVASSVRRGSPVHLIAKEDLDASLSAGRAGLLREEDDR